MSCAVFMIFYNIDSKTTDLMKKDLDARRARERIHGLILEEIMARRPHILK